MKRNASEIKCPKCHTIGVSRFAELWTRGVSEIEFVVESGDMVHQMHNPPDIDPTGVCAICHCGHRWRLRGVLQITEINPK